jgi:hypothetical protein
MKQYLDLMKDILETGPLKRIAQEQVPAQCLDVS